MSYKSEIFNEVLNDFECEDMKLFCIDLLEARSDINYHIPSSTSMKYHNATQCQPGGQILHEIMVATVMNYLLGLEYLQVKYPKPKQRDCFRIAAIMHDCCKTNGGQYTVHEHPILSGQFVEDCKVEHDIDIKLKQYINRLIQSHSGQWISSNRSDIVLPKPENDAQFLIHLCDYLSSRANIDMTYSKEVLKLINDNISSKEHLDINTWCFKVGKYKNMTIPEVMKKDFNYLLWVKKESDMGKQEPLRTFLQSIE